MRVFKQISSIIIFIVSILALLEIETMKLSSFVLKDISTPINVSVLIGNYKISITSLIKDELEKIEQQNPSIIHYTFYDGQGNQHLQNTQINTILSEKKSDLIIVDMVDLKYTKYAVDRIKENNLPAMFWGNVDVNAPLSYNNSCSIRPDPAEGGTIQGKIIVDEWSRNKRNLDKNGDNILQYIMLEGTPTNIYAPERKKYALDEIQKNNIQTKELATRICNWNEEEAKNAIRDLFLKYGNNIEVIIANDDAMAIGAISALQEYGYNLINTKQDVRVIGFDGIPKAQELIKNGVMSGTVIEDPYYIAKILNQVGINLVNKKNLIENTNALFDENMKTVRIPYQGVLVNFT